MVVPLLGHVQLFATPWTACSTPGVSVLHCGWSMVKFMSTESVMPSNHLILSSPSPAFNLPQHQGLFQRVSSFHQVAKVLGLQLQHQSFQRIFRLISFRMDWFDLLAVQGILKSLLQHHSSKGSILQHSAFKGISVLLNALSRFIIVFLPRSKHLLVSNHQV